MNGLRRSADARPSQYPLATLAAYGPDNTLATKLVASVTRRPGRDPSAMQTWTTEQHEIRNDPEIADEVAAFLARHRVKDSISTDRVIGCPHEEGIDYPLGRTCPRCPFWSGIDRFTHQPLTHPEPTRTPAEILSDLSVDTVIPYDALESADAHREALVQPLLDAIERGLADPPGASAEESRLFAYALYLLARWREPRAYPAVVRWLALPGEGPFDIAGDIVTQDGAGILAAVCDQDLEPIKALALDRRANEYGRGAGVTALGLLAAWAEVPHEPIVDMLLWLAREGLEREPGEVWNSLAVISADIEALPLFPELRRAYDDGLIDWQTMHPKELDEVEAAPPGSVLEATIGRNLPIDDVVDATAWWKARTRSARDLADDPYVVPETYRAPPKVGRNEPCPCGSGKKFKKCCGG